MRPSAAATTLESARRRARWGIALLGSAVVLWFGGYTLGGSAGPMWPVSAAQWVTAAIFGILGLIQLWRAALGATPLAIVTATLATAAVASLAAHALLGGRGEFLIFGAVAMLVAAGISGAVVASSSPRPPVDAPAKSEGGRGIQIALITAALAVLVILGAVDLLVWSPLAQTEGLALEEVYAGLSEFDRSYGLLHIVSWIAFWTVAVLSFAIVAGIAARRRAVARRSIYAAALGLVAAIVFFQFWAGFSLGMSIADTLPPYRGGGSSFARVYALIGQLSLVGVILLTIAPMRRVGPAGIEPTTSTV